MIIVFDRNIEATEFLLNTILEREDMNVIGVIGQREYRNLVIGGHFIRMIFIQKIPKGKFTIFKYNVQTRVRMCIEPDSTAV